MLSGHPFWKAAAAALLAFAGAARAGSNVEAFTLADPELIEASGLAASPSTDGLLWLVNDSGGKPMLYATGTDGSARGRVAVRGVKNRDWEEVAAFTLEGAPYLLIADTGDNRGQHPSARLHIVREPRLKDGIFPREVPVAWTIDFTYEDGPRDVESVAVDGAAGEIFLLSKRDSPPRLYRLPLRPRGSRIVARRVGEIRTLPVQPALEARFDPYGPQPTSMSIAPDGGALALLTYRASYLYRRAPGEAWIEALARPPERLAIPRLPQAESIGFSREGRSIFAASEGETAPLIRLDLPR